MLISACKSRALFSGSKIQEQKTNSYMSYSVPEMKTSQLLRFEKSHLFLGSSLESHNQDPVRCKTNKQTHKHQTCSCSKHNHNFQGVMFLNSL